MIIQKRGSQKRAIKASNRRLGRTRRAIRANDEEVEDIDVAEEGNVSVAPEASDLLFEAEDVAELVAEVTGQNVDVTADEDAVVFEVGEDQYTVEAEGDEEILESTKKGLRGKRAVRASRRMPRRARSRR